MLAKNFEIGDKLKHINGDILTIVKINEFKYFENNDGDTFKYIDDYMIFYKI
ncbi:TPA: hypothetical protein ACXDAZ_002510 [Clostridium botulinum]